MKRAQETNASTQGRERKEPNGHAVESLWLALAARSWTTLVVVPADPTRSSAALATALAEVGTRLSYEPVAALAIAADEDPRVLADVQQMVLRDRDRARHALAPELAGSAEGTGGPAASPRSEQAAPPKKTIISIPAVNREHLGVAIARAADAVVVAVEMRRTRIADARRTIELIGRDRIAGCYLAH
jgi:hypothetical protein